jgi:peptidoglycan/LPS O-acetylase OafA/YrhL
MAITAWSLRTGWIAVALISLILIAPLGTAFIEPRRRDLARLAQEAPDGLLPQALQQRIHDPILGTALQTVTILLLGIVFLMTTKPELIGSIIVMAVALVLGLASGLLFSRATRTRQLEASTMNREREPVRFIGHRSASITANRLADLSALLKKDMQGKRENIE